MNKSNRTYVDQPVNLQQSGVFFWSFMLLGALLLGLSGCAAPFSVKTPPKMVEVTSKHDSEFDYRATTIEGVVVGVRVLSEPAGSGVESPGEAFWIEAIKQRLREQKGYALTAQEQVTSANGHRGTLLKFGRDQHDTTFIYWVTLYRTEDNLHIVDAGGRKDRFEAALSVVQDVLSSYQVEP